MMHTYHPVVIGMFFGLLGFSFMILFIMWRNARLLKKARRCFENAIRGLKYFDDRNQG